MVGMRTRRSPGGKPAMRSSHSTPATPERLGVGHDVGLTHRHEIGGAEILSDLDLMLDRPLRGPAELAGPQRFLLVGLSFI